MYTTFKDYHNAEIFLIFSTVIIIYPYKLSINYLCMQVKLKYDLLEIFERIIARTLEP